MINVETAAYGPEEEILTLVKSEGRTQVRVYRYEQIAAVLGRGGKLETVRCRKCKISFRDFRVLHLGFRLHLLQT